MTSPFTPPTIPGAQGYPLGLTGAIAATRYVGATASGAPASGTFAVGDFVIDQTGKVYVCTTAGTPGTWTQAGGGGGITEIGTTTPGASVDADTVSAAWAQQVTPAAAKPIRAIAAHVAGSAGSQVSGPFAMIFDDNAGAPGKCVAHSGLPAALYGPMLSTTYRWLYIPIYYLPAAGTPIWLVFGRIANAQAACDLHYTTGGADTDRKIRATSAFGDDGWGASTSRTHSIKAAQDT